MQIQIKPKKLVKTRLAESAYVSFPYDKFIIDVIRGFPSRAWHPTTKQWEIELESVPKLISVVKNQPVTINCENKRYLIDEELEREFVPEVTDYMTTSTLFQHQKEAVDYGMHHRCMLLADEPGLGKTLSFISLALNLREHFGCKHALVVCGVNSIKWNWVSEIRKHTTGEEPYIIGQRRRKNGRLRIEGIKERLKDLEDMPDNFFLITNIETLRDERVAEKLESLCLSKVIGLAGVDESHLCVNPTALQSTGLQRLNAENKVAMTGTPVINAPLDLWVILYWMGIEKHNFYQFEKYYCDQDDYHKITGYKHLDELRAGLNRVMLRRLKKDVIDLPPQVFTTTYVEMGDEQSVLYEAVYNTIHSEAEKVSLSKNPLVKMLRLRQATGSPQLLTDKKIPCAKLETLDALLEERISQGRKCLVFTNWAEVALILKKRYEKYNPAVIMGKVKDEDRKQQEYKFNADETCGILIGTIKSMGVSLTLNAADTVIFYDEPWNYSAFIQASDRAYRIGQTKSVQIISLIAKETIDERIHDIVDSKKELSEFMVDFKKKGGFFEFLLS